MSGPWRTLGGRVDRGSHLRFAFDGRQYTGHPGDTLASALLANGVRLVGRSFKYHRPRGIFTAGPEEPNALMQLGEGAATDPNRPATVTELFDGLVSRSQNYKGSLRFDWMAINDYFSPFLVAGFYYKTFMWPASFWEKVYEPAIRNAAGLGRLSGEEDPDQYDKGFRYCDLLVIGAGAAGLAAALTAGRGGASVILADEDFLPGGRLNAEMCEIDGQHGHAWAAAALAELSAMRNVRVMTRTTVFGVYDHGIHGALERCTEHLSSPGNQPRQVLWRIYARRSLLCAGAIERGIAFGANDRPGIMLAGAVRTYLNRFGVAAGRSVAIFTNNDDGWRTAHDLAAAGVYVPAIIDSREEVTLSAPADTEVIKGGRIVDTKGRLGLREVVLAGGRRLVVDALAVSGGWNPAVNLTCHQRGRPLWREAIAAFVPDEDLPPGMAVAGAANGAMTLAAALHEGRAGAAEALAACGRQVPDEDDLRASDEPAAIEPFWYVEQSKGRAWLDLQNDVTVKDVRLAAQEGFASVEHMKRYTTLGMATDQGKTANVPGLAILAQVQGKKIPDVGTTIFRPPYTPVPIAAFAGHARGREFRPLRLTASHEWAQESGATFVEAGLWLRAQMFPREGETHWRQTADREVKQTREAVGICDVSTLGKIDIKGRDAGSFLDRVYTGTFSTLAVGKVRYGLMLREDGMVFDDGTTARLGEQHYLMTTTTANAGAVLRHLEFCRQCLWPGLDVHLTSVTDQFAQFAIAGPHARNLLERVLDDGDISNAAFPFMACGSFRVAGVVARLFRISFSGELAYEIAVPARYGDALVRRLMSAGHDLGAVAYGVEALGVMRIEKGHPAGGELNGQTTAGDLGLGRMLSTKKDFVGRIMAQRPGLVARDRMVLVGFKPVDAAARLLAGAHFLGHNAVESTENDEGWMSSVAYSPSLGHMIGLGFLTRGRERMGELIRAYNPVQNSDIEVEVTALPFIDPQGERLRV